MKKSILSVGKILNKEAQKTVNGGGPVGTVDCYREDMSGGGCLVIIGTRYSCESC